MKKFAKLSLYKGIGLALIASISVSAMATSIYKVVDENGRITFTDNPQRYENQAGKTISPIAVSESTALLNNRAASNPAPNSQAQNNQAVSPPAPPQQPNSQNAQTSNQAGNENNSQNKPQAPSPNYQLTMIEPSSAQAYRRPAQNIVVNLQVKPALKSGDSATIYIDGAAVAQGLSASIATVDLLPGEHTLSAVITNQTGQKISQVSQVVYVIQNTAVLQNKKKLAEQLQAYERLSWPQKVLLKIRQDSLNQAEAAKKRQTAPKDPFGALIGK